VFGTGTSTCYSVGRFSYGEKCNRSGPAQSRPFFIMSSQSVQMSEVVNWCKFIPLRGPTGARHEAPEGEDYCKYHQRHMSARETKERMKQAEENRQRRLRIIDEKIHSISILESQEHANRYLDAQEEELERRLQERTTPTRNSRTSSPRSPPPHPPPRSSSSRSSSRSTHSTHSHSQPPLDMQAIINAAVAEALRQRGVSQPQLALSQPQSSVRPSSSIVSRTPTSSLRSSSVSSHSSPHGVISVYDDESDVDYQYADDLVSYSDNDVDSLSGDEDDVDQLSHSMNRARIR
jgi:hypothetical protein